MILQNKKGVKKEFKVLFLYENDSKKYVVYQDLVNDVVYAGIKNDNSLTPINNSEKELLDRILESIES